MLLSRNKINQKEYFRKLDEEGILEEFGED